MFQQLISQFTQSRQGQTAMSRLQSQGFAPQQAQAFMGAALPAAAQGFHQARSGGALANMSRPGGPQGILDVGNSHYVTNFLSGAVSGLIRGEGMMGAAVDGLQGVVGGHVAQVIASRFGLPQRVAGTVGAIITPLAIDFLWERVNGGGLDLGSMFGGGAPQPGAAAGGWGGQGGQGPQGGQVGQGGGQPALPAGGPPAGGMPGRWGGQPSPGGFGGAPQPGAAGGSWGGQGGGGQGAASGGVSPTVRGGLGSLFGQLFKG